jgi:hypothetical protein
MEQFPDVCLRRRGLGKSELSGMAAQDNVFRLAVPLIRNPRMSGAPGGFLGVLILPETTC